MAVISVEPRGIGCSGAAKQGIGSTGADAQVSKRYRAHYRVTCDSPLDTAPVVYAYLETNKGTQPWFGNSLTLGNGSDSSVVITELNCDPVENGPGMFDLTAVCEPANVQQDTDVQPGTGSGASISTNPLEWYDDIDVSFTQTSVAAEFAIFHGFFDTNDQPAPAQLDIGNRIAITNSAREPYNPPIEDEKQIKVIRISHNVSEYNDSDYEPYQGTVNSDIVVIDKRFYGFFTVIHPLTGLIRVGAQFNIQNGVKYWRRLTEIWVDRENWRRKILDKGRAAAVKAGDPNGSGSQYSSSDLRAEGNAPLKTLTDAAGYPLAAPSAFNGNGQPKNEIGGVNYYGHWGIKPEVPWSPLAGKAW